jgi:ribosome modulation factor
MSDDLGTPKSVDPMGVGMDAYARGIPRSSCPYPEDSTDAQRWLKGWDHQAEAEGGTADEPR